MSRCIWGLALALLLAACGSNQQPPAQGGDTQINGSLEQMARVFARSMSDASLRSVIKEAATKRFDGDTEVLYQDLAAQKLMTGQTVEQQLALAYQQELQAQRAVGTLSLSAASEKLAALAQSNPRLQVAVRGKLEAWDPSAYTPLVAFAPEGVEDTALAQVTAYDGQGRVHLLDAQKEPQQPVIVIGLNERINDQGELLPLFVPSGSGEFTLLPSPPAATASVEAQARNDEKLHALYLRDKHEPWIRGDPEIMLKVASQKIPHNGPYAGGFNNADDTGKWYYYYRPLFYWTSTNVGNWIIYFWYERDGGSSVTVSVNASYRGVGVNASFTIQDGDDRMGHALVDIAQRYQWTRHDTGDIVWYRYAY